MKKNWPPISKTIKNGKNAFLVDARHAGKGERRFFSTRTEADTFAASARIRRINEGNASVSNDRLARYGWTVHRAIAFALDHLDRQAASLPVAKAVEKLAEFKASRVGAIRLADIKNRLARFSRHFKGRAIATITPEEINAFLAAIPHPATRNDYRKEIVMLWHFANANKWVREPLDRHLVQRAKEPEKGRVILSTDEAARLMAASLDPEARALNALVLFGGCRRDEVEKMDWQHINFSSGHIEIPAEISKVNRERFAPITDNLRAWLLPLAQPKGKIIKRTLMHVLRDTWKRAGLYPWPQDAHRHSFISYRRRIIGDAQTALDAGTSETIIKRHYKRPTTREDAELFFAIVPQQEDGKNVLPFARGKAA
jgi:integrase